MDTRFLAGLCYLLFLTAAMAPSALGHDERPALAIPYGGDPDGVSGRYVGAAGPALAVEAYNETHPAHDVLVTGGMFCDAEVVVDLAAFPGNEGHVDGFGTGTGVPDSFDDGGNGGACHTNYYATSEFNTPGCQGGQTARGSNGVGDIWIGASCDWKTDEGPSDPPSTLELCLLNGVLAFNPLEPPVPTGAVGEALVLVDCIEAFVHCVFGMTDCHGGGVESCGPDNTSDAIDFGYGSGNANPAVFPVATGIMVWWSSETSPCALEDEVASIFVFDTVATNGGSLVDPDGPGPLEPVYVPGSVDVYPAFAGELWTDL